MVAGIIVVELLDVTLHVTLWMVKTTFGGVYNLVKYVASQTPKSDPKSDSEKPKSDSEKPKADSEQPSAPNSDSEESKADSEEKVKNSF